MTMGTYTPQMAKVYLLLQDQHQTSPNKTGCMKSKLGDNPSLNIVTDRTK